MNIMTENSLFLLVSVAVIAATVLMAVLMTLTKHYRNMLKDAEKESEAMIVITPIDPVVPEQSVFTDCETTCNENTVKPARRCRGKGKKRQDTSHFTKDEWDIVMAEKAAAEGNNAKVSRTDMAYITNRDLAANLNAQLNKNKSVSSYARIWNGQLLRHACPGQIKLL